MGKIENIQNYYKNEARKKLIKKKYGEMIMKEVKTEQIKNKYGEMTAKEGKVSAAIYHSKENRSSGDKSKIAYQNCLDRWPKFVGTYEEFKQRIEDKFKEEMCWEDYPKWEVDHIYPLSKGGSHHFMNLQPLWRHENRSKLNKIL